VPFLRKRLSGGRSHSPFGYIFWLFLAGCLALGWFLGQEMWADWQATQWPKVPCEILVSEVEPHTGRNGHLYYGARIEYRYLFGDRTYTSDQIRARGASRSSELAVNQQLVGRFPVGLRTECHVNPQNPAEAALEPRAQYFLPLIALSPMFIWMLYEHVALGEWLARRRERRSGTRRPLTDLRPARRWRGQFFLGVVTVIFSGMGIFFFLAHPWWRARQAVSWAPTPCRILQSEVRTERHHQGWTFKADIAFAYVVNGREYLSQKPDFSEDLGTSYAATEALVAIFPAGSTNLCYVNPRHPADAVLRPIFRLNGFLTIFVLSWFGLGCFFMVTGAARRLRRLSSGLPWEYGRGAVLSKAPLINLEPAQNAWLLFVLSVLGGLLCLGLSLWLGEGVLRSLRRGGFDLLPACYAFLSGFGVVQAVKYARRNLDHGRHPAPKLGLRPAVLVPGHRFHIAWVWKGGARQARPFRLWLEGSEEAYVTSTTETMHGQMKNEKLAKARFAGRLLAEIPAESTAGSREFDLPADLIPSFESLQARIVWHLRVEVMHEKTATSHDHKILIRTPAQ